ncbi:MAG: hypothetical protein CVU89_16805 [Firmicutes bacterium HGW-Firmicutes-14]|jgi:hypothetical protein|nr:MAG: hypothetical protein CVU89_16805 [Firmicutes bacterium HGW-Firmicutes-14]
MAHGYCTSIGYFFGRLDSPDELTIAFLGNNDDVVIGLASLLSDIGPQNLRVSFKLLPSGLAEITVYDERDPENFSDTRQRPAEHIMRFLHDLQNDKRFIITVGDLNLNLNYDILRLELDKVDYLTEYLN